ncbi:MAG: 4Fe-4S dicluster domain / Domain of unknown function DUF3470, partial [uncultured Sphingomonas sp.]
DLRRHRRLHPLQVHGLRRGLPGRLLLRRRQHARHQPQRMHRLRRVRARMPGGGDPARYRERQRAVARAQRHLLEPMAQHHPQEGQPARRGRIQGQAGQVRRVFLGRSWHGGL